MNALAKAGIEHGENGSMAEGKPRWADRSRRLIAVSPRSPRPIKLSVEGSGDSGGGKKEDCEKAGMYWDDVVRKCAQPLR